jgi:hypothetical protein
MLQTYEATLEPSGQVLFTDFAKPVYQQRQKVLITIVSSLADNASDHEINSSTNIKDLNPTWMAFAGALKDSPVFAGAPLLIQNQLRGEWR